MKEYNVQIPIAGHAWVTVEAKDAEEAKELAMAKVTIDDVEEWTSLEMFNEGNVCYCPQPWEITVEGEDDEDEDDEEPE